MHKTLEMVTFFRRFVVWNLEGVSIFCGISLVENRRQVWKRPTNSQEREKRRLVEVELEINIKLEVEINLKLEVEINLEEEMEINLEGTRQLLSINQTVRKTGMR